METSVGRRKASATCYLLLTYLISARALAASTASKGPHTVALCLPTTSTDGCLGSTVVPQSSAAVRSLTRSHQQPTALSLARAPMRREGSPLFERTRAPTAEHMHGSRGGAAARLQASASDSTGGPAAVPVPSIAVVADAAASPAGGALDAAESGSSAAGPPVLSLKWGREQAQRLQRQVCELPEDTAEEGRFLMMAALVGVITGTAGESAVSPSFVLHQVYYS